MLQIQRLPGRCADGAERGAGTLWHAVEQGSHAAICGAKPGRRSVGWTPATLQTFPVVTCPRCRKRLSALATQETFALLRAAREYDFTPRIMKSAWDNWYGYMGDVRVAAFMNTTPGYGMQQEAEAWLAAEQAKREAGLRPPNCTGTTTK